jgi:hypothetical protein
MSEATSEAGSFDAAERLGTRAVEKVAEILGADRIWNGGWFRRLVEDHIHKHEAQIDAAHWDQVYPDVDEEGRAAAEIARVAQHASVAGAFASAGASTGELLSLFSDGLAAPVGVPAAAASMIAEAAYTTLLQIDLACDLASIYGVPFRSDDLADISTIFSLALELQPPRPKEPGEDDTGRPAGLTERLLEAEDGELGRRIGRKLLEESLMRNILPVIGIAVSARWNYVATRKLGATVRRYVRYRRALTRSLRQLKFEQIAEPEILVEGAWLLATVSGEPNYETTMALSLIIDALPESARRNIHGDHAFGDDEEGWFDALALAPSSMHVPLLDVLYLVAASDRILQPGERRFLKRVARAVEMPCDLERVEKICRHLRLGEMLPSELSHIVR